MNFYDIYHNYKHIKQYVIGRDIRNVGPVSLFTNISSELLYLLWPATTKETELQNKRLLYALTYVAIAKSPINSGPYTSYLRDNAFTLLNIDKSTIVDLNDISIVMDNILYDHKIYMLYQGMPDHTLDIIELKNAKIVNSHEFYKHHTQLISINTNETGITNKRKIHCRPIIKHVRDILRTNNIKDSIYKDVSEKDSFLYWLNDCNKTKLITNIFQTLDIMIINDDLSDILQEYLENAITAIERLVPEITNARLKINNSIALGLTPLNIAEMLLQDGINIENIAIPEIAFNNF